MAASAWNRRFVLYALAKGQQPEEVVAHGGFGADFICWIRRRWDAWRAAVRHNGVALTAEDHAAFDAWLSEAVEQGRMPLHGGG